ncbi:MAG: nitrogen regulation protein NR(I) [Rhizobiaceae bacterium]|nr:nitrogen regulation protein NR(I) [Rhizobiaceae bacterium]
MTEKPKTVLLADDDAAIRTVLNQALTRAGFETRTTSNIATLWRWISSGEGDLVVSDVVMPDGNVFDLMPRITRHRPDLPLIVMSAQNTFMTAIKASELGAYDYLPKPFDLNELIAAVKRAFSQHGSISNLKPADDSENMPLVGRSSAMQDVYRVLARLMQTDLTLMVTGESGTGKELVARALHDYGKRRHAPFVAINMAAIPKDLIESELFGHEKGAFTGAHNRSTGNFEQAEGGTLFLDEIGDMPMEAQTRLLRVLQQGEYTRVGGRVPIRSDVRIIAATNKNLNKLIKKGLFREDLYYRLNVVPLRIPPLRERADDIPDLVRHFIQKAELDGLGVKSFENDALITLSEHLWPGNVRELENLVRRLLALYPQETINRQVIEHELSIDNNLIGDAMSSSDVTKTLREATECYVHDHFSEFEIKSAEFPTDLYQKILHEIEHPLIVSTLAATGGNQIKAAELLGLNRNTLRKKIKDLDIKVLRTLR